MLIRCKVGNCWVVAFVERILYSSFFCLFANLTKPSKYSNSPRMVKMVSIGVRDILPLMKCVKILYLSIASFSNPILTSFFQAKSPSSTSSCPLTTTSTKTLCLGTLVCENRSWLPLILFN